MKRICIVLLAALIAAEYGPIQAQADPRLEQALNQQRQLIAHADTQGLFDKISECYREIDELEAQAGISWRKPHAATLSMLCGACDHQKGTLAAQLRQLDRQRTVSPATRCRLHRLYIQAAGYALQLETLLKPYKQELRNISDRIHQLSGPRTVGYGRLFL